MANIQTVTLSPADDPTAIITIEDPENPANNAAYFIPSTNAWDDLASVPVADEIFETDSAEFRCELGKIQYAARTVMIIGVIRTPQDVDHNTAAQNRVKLLYDLQTIVARKELILTVTAAYPFSTPYMLYCHLHGADGLRVVKYPHYYAIALTVTAEDPLLYTAPATHTSSSQPVTVVNNGNRPHYGTIIISGCNQVTGYLYTINGGTPVQVDFRTPYTGSEIQISVQYPGQTCSIAGISPANIDTSNGKPMYLQIPVGTSSWWILGGSCTAMTIISRNPLGALPV